MAILTLRLVKGTPLTNQEVDGNFSNLNSDINTLYAQVSSNANITGGNITGLANLASSGNVYGNYFLGNGSLLTGISVDSTRILFGNTAVVIVGNNGAISANINNTSVMTIDKDGATTANIQVLGNITANVTKTSNLQDSSGRTLVILDENDNVVWGN